MRHLPQCFKAPKSRILSTRRLRRALLIPKPQHLQLIDGVHSHSKTAEQDASVTDAFHSIFLLHRGFQETVQICVCAEVPLEGAASMEAVGLPATPPRLNPVLCSSSRRHPWPHASDTGGPSPTQQEVHRAACPNLALLPWESRSFFTHTHAQLLTPHCTGKDWAAESHFLSALVLRGPLTTFPPLGSPPWPPRAAAFTAGTSY